MSESQKTISQSEWTKLRNCIEALKLASRELGGSLGETCDIEYHVALRVFRDVESADKNPSNSQAPITPAAIALLNAERVRGQMAAYGPDFNTPEVGEAKAREIGPHTLELCRLAVEQWYRCSPTPQPLSTTMIRMRDAVIFAAQEERDELSRRNQAGDSSPQQ